jgi:glycosyltransferase involved in cell wall biosynthesis
MYVAFLSPENMKTLIYFCQFFPPEHMAAAFRCYENAKAWTQAGIKVTVFTGYPNYPLGKIFDGYDAKLLGEEYVDDIHVFRNKLIAMPNTNFFRRVLNAKSLFKYGYWNLRMNARKIGKHYDVALGTSGPIFNAILGYLFARKHNIPFVFELRDITYLQLGATGKPQNSIGVRLMKYLETFLCKKAAMVVCVTQGFKDVLTRECGIVAGKIQVILNGVSAGISECREIDGSSFTLSYFGTLGISQNVADTLPYAEVIRRCIPNFKYRIIGDGAQSANVRQACEKEAFVEFLHGMSPEELEPYYSETMLSMVVLRKSKNFRCTIPSKLFQTMGRGIAVLYIGPEGEAAEMIRQCEAGIVLTKNVEEDLKDLRDFFSQSDWSHKLQNMGRKGREAALKHYTRKKLAAEYLRALKACVEMDGIQ